MIEAPFLEALRGCLDSGLQQVTFVSGSKKAAFLFAYAVHEAPLDNGLETDSEDFTSNSDAVSDVDDDYGEDLVFALGECIHPCIDDYSAPSFTASNRKLSFFKKKLSYLDERSQITLSSLLKASSMVVSSLQNLSPAHVPVKHYFKLRGNRSIHHRPRRMAPKHNKLIRKEWDNLLDAGIFVPASAPWNPSVVIASKRDGK